MRALAVVMVLAGAARADVDWGKGLVTAEGVGVADRHAPSPAVARGTSRRVAEDAARKEIAAGLGALPVAAGGTVADRARDPAVKARLERAVANAYAIAGEPETDGAWRVTMAVPIEAVRQAIDGPRVLAAGGDKGAAPVIVIDGVTAKPAVGWTIAGKHAAAIWVAAAPAWTADAPHVRATHADAGAIAADAPSATDATLFVVLGYKP